VDHLVLQVYRALLDPSVLRVGLGQRDSSDSQVELERLEHSVTRDSLALPVLLVSAAPLVPPDLSDIPDLPACRDQPVRRVLVDQRAHREVLELLERPVLSV